MNAQVKDLLYDEFLKEPTKENFRIFLQKNYGEMDHVDFKEKWIEKGHLAKTMLAMANASGGVIVFGVQEKDDGSLYPVGLEKFADKAEISNSIVKFVPSDLDYRIFDYSYDTSEYEAVQNKKFQILIVYDTPDRLPLISLAEGTGIDKNIIYIRRGTKCEKADAREIENIISRKVETIFKSTSDLKLKEHLDQLKTLYGEVPPKINVLIRKRQLNDSWTMMLKAFSEKVSSTLGERDEYEEQDNPYYPAESYEAFISKMIEKKKLKIEKVLDLK